MFISFFLTIVIFNTTDLSLIFLQTPFLTFHVGNGGSLASSSSSSGGKGALDRPRSGGIGRSKWQVADGIEVVDWTDSSEDTGKGNGNVTVLVEQFDRSSSCLYLGCSLSSVAVVHPAMTASRRITEPLITTNDGGTLDSASCLTS